MRISVVIPTRDRVDLVTRAVRSALAQTVPAYEVIVVDDGSEDGTRERLQELGREHATLRVEVQENRGVSAARNRGIRAASGDWIAFLDSDDEWRPEKLERQRAALAASPGHRLCHSDEIWIRRGNQVLPRRRHAKRGGWIFAHCLPRCAISPSAALVERRLLLEVGLFDEDLPVCEDYDLWLRICAAHPVLFVPEPLVVKYGGHDDQLSRRHWGMDRFRIRALDKILESGRLGDADHEAALATLIEKLGIVLAGARKRGRGRCEIEALEARLLAAREEREMRSGPAAR